MQLILDHKKKKNSSNFDCWLYFCIFCIFPCALFNFQFNFYFVSFLNSTWHRKQITDKNSNPNFLYRKVFEIYFIFCNVIWELFHLDCFDVTIKQVGKITPKVFDAISRKIQVQVVVFFIKLVLNIYQIKL
jgi:hypothetical protein